MLAALLDAGDPGQEVLVAGVPVGHQVPGERGGDAAADTALAAEPRASRDVSRPSGVLMISTCAPQCDRDQVRFFLEETAETGEAFTFFNRSQETPEFAGGKVSLGWVTEIAHSAKLDNLGELRTWYDSGGDGRIEVRLAPANNNQLTVRLSGAREETDIDPAAPIPP